MNRVRTLVVLGCCAVAMPAQAVDGVKLLGQPKHFPITIAAPGSYRLKGNLTVADANTTAILVQTNDVTIDLNGFTISGPCTGGPPCSPSGSGKGIDASSPGLNITVLNGTVRGMGDNGIEMLGGRVERVSALSNGANGISGADIAIGCTAVGDGGNGILVSVFGVISGCSAVGNAGSGLACAGAGFGVVTNSNAKSNGGSGIHGCAVMSDSTADGNGQEGIFPDTGFPEAGVVTGCSANGNTGNGMSGSAVTNSTALSNHAAGIAAITANGCYSSLNTTAQITTTGNLGHNICGSIPCP